jgi:hypothetical protein
MSDVLPTLAVFLTGIVFLWLQLRRYTTLERPYLVVSFLTHVLCAFAQVWITKGVYIRGDMFNYFMWGGYLSHALDVDFEGAVPEILNLLLQQSSVFDSDIEGAGSSTGSMTALAGVLLYWLGGSIYATCMLISVAAYFSGTALYQVFRSCLPESHRTRLLIGCLLVPSVVYWSAGILKEAVVLGSLGWMCIGMQHTLSGRIGRGVPALVFGAVLVSLVKPYVLFAFLCGAAVWIYWHRAQRTGAGSAMLLRPVYLVIAASFAALGIAMLGKVFPQFSIEMLAEEAARYQGIGEEFQGGSSYSIGNPEERTLLGQLQYAPIALISSLFRPFIFEARTPLMLANAFETTALLVMLVVALYRWRWSQLWNYLSSRPELMFCLVFTLVFGIGVGLATTNMGTLSRYRTPLMPFFAVLVLVAAAPVPARGKSPAPARLGAHAAH